MPFGFSTTQIHAGQGPEAEFGSRIAPIHLSAGFVFEDFDEARDRFSGVEDGFVYTRYGNPTLAAVEAKLAALESGRNALVVASGQAAVSTALLTLAGAGDHVVVASSIYEGTRGLFTENFARLGVSVSFVANVNNLDEWVAAAQPNTKAFFAESIANPRNEVLNIPEVAEVAHRVGVPLVIDNTLATPYLVRPIDHGADIVVHSTSKFLAGHGAALGGVVIDSGRFSWSNGRFAHLAEPTGHHASFVERFGSDAFDGYARTVVAARFGPTLSPFNAFLLQQGIETLSLRVERHSHNAAVIARWLESRPEVARVDYSGLEGNAYFELGRQLLPRGNGSVFSFELVGGVDAARTVINRVRVWSHMSHLGDVRSLILHPASTSHVLRSTEELDDLGITAGLLRVSVGIEDAPDLIADLDQAFAQITSGGLHD